MPGKFWTDQEKTALINAWKKRRADITQRQFSMDYADSTGRSAESIRMMMQGMAVWKIPPSTRATWTTPPRLTGDALVLMDTQIPFHHAEFINRCLDVCARWGIEQLVLGGDALDLNALNQFAPNFENDDKSLIDTNAAEKLIQFADGLKAKDREKLLDIIGEAERENTLGGEIKEAKEILRALEKQFDKVVWIMGNHEQRILRTLNKIMPAQSLATLFGADSPKWEVSPYYYCILESGGEEWQIEHPVNTAKHSSKRLAPKFGKHIIMGHNHQFSITTDPSGRYYAIEPGMCMDEERMGYVMQRHNTADTHMVGAVIVRDGKPTPLNKFTDWEMLK